MSHELNHAYAIYIQASPEQVWQALTDPALTVQYNFHSAARSDWRPGSDYAMTAPDGTVTYDGQVLAADPPRLLSQSVHVRFAPRFAGHRDFSIDWEVEQYGDACLVTIRHHGASADAELFAMLTDHCPDVMSGLETLLETGKPLRIGQRGAAQDAED